MCSVNKKTMIKDSIKMFYIVTVQHMVDIFVSVIFFYEGVPSVYYRDFNYSDIQTMSFPATIGRISSLGEI